MNWNKLFADRIKGMKRSSIREILKLTAKPDVISFAGGLPAPEYFPVERVKEASDTVLSERGQEVLQYSTTEGMPELRQMVADSLSTSDLTVGPENIIITAGSQQGLDLVCRILLNEGDKMVVENPTYLGMLMAARPFHPTFVPIPTDHDGVIVDALPPLLEQNPKMVYMVPNFQNPQGITLSTERRKQLVALTYDKPLVLIEDNPYGELRYSGDPPPTLLSLDAQQRGSNRLDGNVAYIGTFSKTLTPGLRIGWVVANETIIDKLIQVKQSADLHTNTFAQFVAYEVAKDGFLEQHITKLRDVYRDRRDTMLNAMEEYFPENVTWQKPDGGLFLMVYMPESVDSLELLEKAIAQKVAFVPGGDFHINSTGHNTFRLNFSNAKPDAIREGIRRLGTLIKAELA